MEVCINLCLDKKNCDKYDGKEKNSRLKKTNIEQIEKKINSWNITREIKIEQAKRIGRLNENLEFKIMILNMLVVLLAISSLFFENFNNIMTSYSLTYSICIILFQNYISKLNYEGQLKEFKLLEFNLDIVINDLENLYRQLNNHENHEKLSNIVVSTKIELLTNKYNSYLQNVQFHTNNDYNVAMKTKKIHKSNTSSKNNDKVKIVTNEKDNNKSEKFANILVFWGILPFIIILLKNIQIIIN